MSKESANESKTFIIPLVISIADTKAFGIHAYTTHHLEEKGKNETQVMDKVIKSLGMENGNAQGRNPPHLVKTREGIYIHTSRIIGLGVPEVVEKPS